MYSRMTVLYVLRGSSPRAWGRCCLHPHISSYRSVHPHVRGADVLVDHPPDRFRGSSPRAWGRCAPPWRVEIPQTVHPHVRGADDVVNGAFDAQYRFIPTCVGQICSSAHGGLSRPGSSPRAWGRSQYSARARLSRAVHPHVRGADSLSQRILSAESRFIPTCVGQMASAMAVRVLEDGSSPRAWGRLIPAARGRAVGAVHPHVRGADACQQRIPSSHCGSSPRAWGRWEGACDGVLSLRFIPTCVGQIARSALRHAPLPVHPHVRGADPLTRPI